MSIQREADIDQTLHDLVTRINELETFTNRRVQALHERIALSDTRNAALANRVAEMELLGCPRCRRTE